MFRGGNMQGLRKGPWRRITPVFGQIIQFLRNVQAIKIQYLFSSGKIAWRDYHTQGGIETLLKADYHLHSHFSDDCGESIERIYMRALELGLVEIAITDHLDPDFPRKDNLFDLDFPAYIEKMMGYRDKWSDLLDLKIGLEIGLQPHLVQRLQPVIDHPSLDFIIGSLHCTDNTEFFDGSFFRGRSKDKAHRTYFQAIYENLSVFHGLSVLGHLDFVRRYGREQYGDDHSQINYSLHMDLIDEILRLAIDKGIGLEVNTSGYRKGLGNPHPDKAILSRYRHLGGEIITLGSDAHKAEDLAEDFDLALEMIEKIGFKYLCGFKQKKPVFYPLEKETVSRSISFCSSGRVSVI